jgi:hypothetical protein
VINTIRRRQGLKGQIFCVKGQIISKNGNFLKYNKN